METMCRNTPYPQSELRLRLRSIDTITSPHIAGRCYYDRCCSETRYNSIRLYDLDLHDLSELCELCARVLCVCTAGRDEREVVTMTGGEQSSVLEYRRHRNWD